MKSARLIITMFAGVVCNPRPARRNERATTNRVKLVTMMRRPGASDNTVSSATSWMIRPLALPPPGGRSEERSGIWAAAAVVRRATSRTRKTRFIDDQGFYDQLVHLAARTDGCSLVEVFAQVLQAPRPFDLRWRDGPQVG